MTGAGRLLGQLVTFALLAAAVASLSQGPEFVRLSPDQGELKISLAHLASRAQACRQLSEEERMALPPTRRVTEVCERGRPATRLVVRINDETWVDERVEAAGWHREGRAYFLTRMNLPSGSHQMVVGLGEGDAEPELSEFTLDLTARESALLSIGDHGVELRSQRLDTTFNLEDAS